MTWAQLRFQILQSAPGLSLDLVDEFLRSRYDQVLESTVWTGTLAHDTIETVAAYQSGADSVTLTVGSVTIEGNSTNWSGALVGRRIYRPGDTVIYTVAAVASATRLTLDRPYEGIDADANGTCYVGAAYVIMQHVYALPADCDAVESIIDPLGGFPLRQLSQVNLDAAAGVRALVGDPEAFAVYDDSAEAAPPVLHQVELYPPPVRARGFEVSYKRNANRWNGTNPTDSPLPWISAAVLLYGARADVWAQLGDLNKAAAYEAKYKEELARLLRVEAVQRRPKTAFAVAGRFTRHRMARVNRNYYHGFGPGGDR